MNEYVDIPNSIVGAFGMLNKACNEANVKYIIKKYPKENAYTGYVGDGPAIEADLCDDLFEKMIRAARSN